MSRWNALYYQPVKSVALEQCTQTSHLLALRLRTRLLGDTTKTSANITFCLPSRFQPTAYLYKLYHNDTARMLRNLYGRNMETKLKARSYLFTRTATTAGDVPLVATGQKTGWATGMICTSCPFQKSTSHGKILKFMLKNIFLSH